MTKRLLIVGAALAAAALGVSPAVARTPGVFDGGGTGSSFADVDGDGDIEPS